MIEDINPEEVLEKLKQYQESETKKSKIPSFRVEYAKEEQREKEGERKKERPEGIKSQLDDLYKKIQEVIPETPKDKKKREKQFGLPNKIKRQLKKLAEKNKLLVFYAATNHDLVPKICKIQDGMIAIDGVPHNIQPDMIFLWKGKYPCVILPEWDLNALGTKDYYDCLAQNRQATPVAIAIRMLEQGQNILKGQFSTKTWVFIGLGAMAVLYVLFGNA